MKKMSLAEVQAPYQVAEAALSNEVTILERNGQPVAAVVPIDEYTAFETWQKQQALEAQQAAIDREHAAFERLLPTLLPQYEGRAVAIYQGEVVGVGDDEMALWAQMRHELGPVPVYVQIVSAALPEFDMPSVEVIGDVVV